MSLSFELLKMGFKERMAYKLDFIFDIFVIPFTFLVIYFIWSRLYEFNAVETVQGFTFTETLTYFAMTIIVMWTVNTWIGDSVGVTISKGDFARYIIFPVDFYKYNMLSQFGSKIPGIIFRIPFFFIAFVLFFKIYVNLNPVQLFLFFVSCVLSFFLLNTFRYMMALFSFWEESHWTIDMISFGIIDLLSGLLVPLDFYPGFLRRIVDVLPFKDMVYSPIMIYMGRMSVADSLLVFANQLFFTLVFYLISRFLFNLGRAKFTSQGG